MKHIRILVLILCACFVSVAWSQQPGGNADWSEFHNRNMQRWNPDEHVLNINNVGSLRPKWSLNERSSVASLSAVAKGVVYFGDGGNLYALNARTGTRLWSYALEVFTTASPAVADGVVYVGSITDSNVYALDANTGTKLWSYAVGGYGVESSPTVANGVVYIGGGSKTITYTR